ncbi:MAG TPA: SDR family oxidoreductase [Cryomorphaceae bacterium]|nr:SDR family oxidoreductase [Cryomorphaceae bacterium]
MSTYKETSEKIEGQTQELPGDQHEMSPEPVSIRANYKGSDKLKNKVALISGGDSGIGRAIAVHYAREGADVALIYLSEDKDAEKTAEMVRKEGRQCLAIKGDITDRGFCRSSVEKVIEEFGKLNILVNHAGEQHPTETPEELDLDLMEKTFRTNIFSMYYLILPALPHLSENDVILTTTSVTGYYGSPRFIDYSATNGAITSLTRSLAQNLAPRKIRVNGVAPGPIWTPLIPASFDRDEVAEFGKDVPLGRPGQPCEVAPAYVFLASEDASYITGQVIHPNGGKIMQS